MNSAYAAGNIRLFILIYNYLPVFVASPLDTTGTDSLMDTAYSAGT